MQDESYPVPIQGLVRPPHREFRVMAPAGSEIMCIFGSRSEIKFRIWIKVKFYFQLKIT
jgi:hypothetical protein